MLCSKRIKLKAGSQVDSNNPVGMELNESSRVAARESLDLKGTKVQPVPATGRDGNPVSLLDANYVKDVLREVNELNAKKKMIEEKFVETVGTKFDEEVSRLYAPKAQVEVIRREIKSTQTLPGLLRLFKDYSVNLIIKNSDTGYKQPLDSSLGELMERLADEIIVHMFY